MKADLMLTDVFPLLDLTYLSESAIENDISQLCKEAVEPPRAAAVCVGPAWVRAAVHLLKNTTVNVATVANFPEGTETAEKVRTDIEHCLKDGAAEIDVVFPRTLFFAGDETGVKNFLSTCRQAAAGATIKIILESGAFPDQNSLARACQLACEYGADFLKTSTGRYTVGTTPETAATLLRVLSQSFPDRGIKISGGIRTLQQALAYIAQARTIMGKHWISPAHFRIGTSRLTA